MQLKLVIRSLHHFCLYVYTGKMLRPPGDEKLLRLLGIDKETASSALKPPSPNKIQRTVSVCAVMCLSRCDPCHCRLQLIFSGSGFPHWNWSLQLVVGVVAMGEGFWVCLLDKNYDYTVGEAVLSEACVRAVRVTYVCMYVCMLPPRLHLPSNILHSSTNR